MNILLVLLTALIVVACGDGAVGPLEGAGLNARISLRQNVDVYRSHGSADQQPLDALILLRQSGPTSTTIVAEMVDLRGWISEPIVSLNGEPLEEIWLRSARTTKVVTDTNLSITLTWPDTVITIDHSMYAWSTIEPPTKNTDTITIRKSAPGPIVIPGLTSDSIAVTAELVGLDGEFRFGWIHTAHADDGTLTIPADILAQSNVGDQILVECLRSFYRTVRVSSPTSGYGDRTIGILQHATLFYLVDVIE